MYTPFRMALSSDLDTPWSEESLRRQARQKFFVEGLLSFFAIVLGSLALVFGFLHVINALALDANGVQVAGSVASVERGQDSNSRVYYFSRFVFNTQDGKKIVVDDGLRSSRRPLYRVGEPVVMVYDPADPQHAHVRSFYQTYALYVFFSVIGFLFVCIGIFLGITVVKQKRIFDQGDTSIIYRG